MDGWMDGRWLPHLRSGLERGVGDGGGRRAKITGVLVARIQYQIEGFALGLRIYLNRIIYLTCAHVRNSIHICIHQNTPYTPPYT